MHGFVGVGPGKPIPMPFLTGDFTMVKRGNPGRGGRGSCGGKRRRDGSGYPTNGNRGTKKQPPPKKQK